MDSAEGLPFGAYLHHYVNSVEEIRGFLRNDSLRTGEGVGNVRVGAFKIFVDGIYRLHTAALNLPYHDAASDGVLIHDEENLSEMLVLAEENNMQVAMHCIGDRATETAIKAVMNARKGSGNPLRHRIIHMQNTRDDLLNLLAKHEIPVEIQPGFVMEEWDKYEGWLGEERVQFAMPCKSLVDNGVVFTSNSDAPVGTLNPAEHIYAAVNRMDQNGKPAGGWLAQECISTDQAFRSYCETPAYLNHSEKLTGQLLPGYQADLMLLDRHPHETENTELNQVRVDTLWYKGRRIFERYP